MCAQKSDKLNNLGTVMSLYSRGTFNKDSFQWTKCVVKYLHDVYAQAILSIVSFLVEVSNLVYTLTLSPLKDQPKVSGKNFIGPKYTL